MLDTPPMIFTEHFDAPVERVWKVFVNERGWDPWFTDGMWMELKNGGRIHFRWERLTNGEVVEDNGYTVVMVESRRWEFWWYEYEKGYRSHVEMVFRKDSTGGTWLTVTDYTTISRLDELTIKYGCAYGWGQMLLLAKLYVEKGLVVI